MRRPITPYKTAEQELGSDPLRLYPVPGGSDPARRNRSAAATGHTFTKRASKDTQHPSAAEELGSDPLRKPDVPAVPISSRRQITKPHTF